MRSGAEEAAALWGCRIFGWWTLPPPLTLRLRSGQAHWATVCRASSALDCGVAGWLSNSFFPETFLQSRGARLHWGYGNRTFAGNPSQALTEWLATRAR